MIKNTKRKRPWLAALLNIIVGLGYIYNGRRILFGSMLLATLILVFGEGIYLEYNGIKLDDPTGWPSVFASFLFYAAFMYDAYQEAKSINEESKNLK